MTGAMPKPARAEIARHLERYREWERRMLAAPDDPRVRDGFENEGRILRTLMGKRCAREAAQAAERRLRAADVAPTPRIAPARTLPLTAERSRAATAPHHASPRTKTAGRATAASRRGTRAPSGATHHGEPAPAG
ncbi:hypothetical protein B0E37_04166 [Streptomyces sp. MH192]|nr:hypothetical protein [Streptomyces sp. MH192]MCF0101180.1 hypothetical protein [Streptomyces sp. MH191]